MAVVGGAWLAETRSEGWAFAAAATAIGSVVGSIFFDLFPRVMVSSTNAAYNLTVSNSASPSYTLKVMTVVAVVFFPLVLAYQGWSLYVFRKRLAGPPAGSDAGGGPPTDGPHASPDAVAPDLATLGPATVAAGTGGEPPVEG